MPRPASDPEAAPLRGGVTNSQEQASSSSSAPPVPHAPPRRLRRLATACLCLAVASSGLALWVRTGRAIREPLGGPGSAGRDHLATAAPVGPSKAAPAPPDHPAPPSFHTAAAEWWAGMVAAYPGPDRDAAFAALAEQDGVEADAAAARFATIDAAAASPPPGTATRLVPPYSGNPADYALSPTLLTSAVGPPSSHPFITVTWCNAAFVPFALNWAAHARAVGLAPFLVGASDEEALKQLLAAGLPTFAMPRLVGKSAGLPQTSPRDLGWGSPAFHTLGREKAALAAALTGSGFNVLLTDVDLVFLQHPGPYFARFPEAALLTSSDGLHRTTVGNPVDKSTTPPLPPDVTGLAVAAAAVSIPGAGDGLEVFPAALDGAAGNIGIMLWRAASHPVAAAWRDALVAEPGAWDQDVFNDLLRAGAGAGAAPKAPPRPSVVAAPKVPGVEAGARSADNTTTAPPASPGGLFRTFGRAASTPASAWAGVLPVDTFASGHTHFVQRLSERTGQPPIAVHTTFQFSGTVGKRHRLRERWLWAVDGKEHFAPQGGLVTLGPLETHPAVARLLGEAAAGGGTAPSLRTHFALVSAQLAIFRAGLALASALNRTLVLPSFWCGADRWWAAHSGVIPLSTLPARLPFRCPADHILDLATMEGERGLDLGEYGPTIPFREAGLVENPRFPATARAPGARGTVEVVVGSGGANATHLTLASALDDAGLRAALSSHFATPVLHFPDPGAVFGGFADPATRSRFSGRVGVSTDLWCCEVGVPAPVWYDAQADVDHVDRHGVRWKGGAWVPRARP